MQLNTVTVNAAWFNMPYPVVIITCATFTAKYGPKPSDMVYDAFFLFIVMFWAISESQRRQLHGYQQCCHMMNMSNCLQLTASQAVLQPCVFYRQDQLAATGFPSLCSELQHCFGQCFLHHYQKSVLVHEIPFDLSVLSQPIDVSFPQNVTVIVLFPYLPC